MGRYFADTREVLFAGAELLPDALADALRGVDDALPPLDAALAALANLGTRLAGYSEHARERRSVIAASPVLLERDRTKTAALTTAHADALRDRGVADSTTSRLAQVGVAILTIAFERWIDRDGRDDFPEVFRAAVGELRSAFDGPAPVDGPTR